MRIELLSHSTGRVKRDAPLPHSVDVLATLASPQSPVAFSPPTVEELFREHADFVWATLYRMGIREADLPDQLQEVFLVAHRRLGSFDGTSKPTTWLFGICMRVAAAHRRRAHVRRERLDGSPDLGDDLSDERSPEEHLSAKETASELDGVLDGMTLERRHVLVMFELEELSCREIADDLGIPIGTVHSRLHAARKEFAELLAARQKGARRG
jgi:RNA polymerase sigma-70 factor, ECF subfamily